MYLHRTGLDTPIAKDPILVAAWVLTVSFIVIQLILAWLQKPFRVDRSEQAHLDQLRVTVVIPCYNEDPQILDRTILSLMRQTRLPDHVEVVDDGSTVDYAEIRDYWLNNHPDGVRFTWVRQKNAGKKHAQAATFTTDHDADIFVTIDSDSALDYRAIDEGLKPFADSRVVSVAGLETAINIDRNLLTRAIGHRSLVFQLFAMSAQSVARGSVLINPGAFSLYWAPLIRKIVPAYLGETFFGVPVTLGDDTALTMYALLHGRAVHQPTAVSMPVYPETLAHHLRQWTRWMRASTIRQLWRIRYLPIFSYGWMFTYYTICSFLISVAITVAIPLAWPASKSLLFASLAAMVLWPWAISLRLATVHRSDQSVFNRMIGVLLLPPAALWYTAVLRQMRYYGILTCWRQGWVTRQKVEVRLDGSHDVDDLHVAPESAEHSYEIPRWRPDYEDHSDYTNHRLPLVDFEPGRDDYHDYRVRLGLGRGGDLEEAAGDSWDDESWRGEDWYGDRRRARVYRDQRSGYGEYLGELDYDYYPDRSGVGAGNGGYAREPEYAAARGNGNGYADQYQGYPRAADPYPAGHYPNGGGYQQERVQEVYPHHGAGYQGGNGDAYQRGNGYGPGDYDGHDDNYDRDDYTRLYR